MQRLEMSTYVNEPPRPKPIHESQQKERRCMQILLLSFGLLCLTQATLNITLRLTANSECSSTVIETQTSLPRETVTDTETTQQCNQLQERVNALVKDKNNLEERITELTRQIDGLNDQNQKLTQQNQDLIRQTQDLTRQTQDLARQTQEPTRQTQELIRQTQDLTRQTQDLTRQTQDFTRQTQELTRQNQDLTRQTQDLARQTQEPTRQTQELIRQTQDLTRQTQDLTRQTQDLTRQTQDLTRQTQELTKQNQDLTRQTQGPTTQNEIMAEERANLQDIVNGSSVCPGGWRKIRGRCYFLSREMRSWDSSRMYCQGYGADLVVINDEQEQRDLYGMNVNTYVVFWIGLHNDTRGTFKWVDNTTLTRAFWQVGQPSDGGPNNQEHCVEMYVRKPVLSSWNDAPCGHLLQWICEKAAHK